MPLILECVLGSPRGLVKTQNGRPHTGVSDSLGQAGVESKKLHLLRVPRRCCRWWPVNHTLEVTEIRGQRLTSYEFLSKNMLYLKGLFLCLELNTLDDAGKT